MVPIMIALEQQNDLKMKHVGSGYGKLVGGTVGHIPGMVAGHYIGKNVPDKPDAPIDPKRASHRFGATYDKMWGMKQAKAGGLGAMIGAGVGAALSAAGGGDPGEGAVAGGTLGGAGGTVGSSMKAGYQTAGKLGYGGVGKVGTATLGPLATLTTPKALRQKMQQRRAPAAA